jgi:hypothetical protein
MTPKDEIRGACATPKMACYVCMKEVPISEIVSFEATDYVVHFCGLDCYDQWKNLPEKSISERIYVY